ncbi:hypothetical protein Dimus_033197 [Dionaea muscipula]
MPNVGTKRGWEGTIEVPKQKRLKMDHRVATKCSDILRELMKHSGLKMPACSASKASKPMDWETIKFKLDNNIYDAAEEFESDVRLTFSNAILSDPPTSNARLTLMAKELEAHFDALWKPVLANTSRARTHDAKQEVQVTGKSDNVSNTCPQKPSPHVSTAPKRYSSSITDHGPEKSSVEKKLQSCIKATKDGKPKLSIHSTVVKCDADSDGSVRYMKEERSCKRSKFVDTYSKSKGTRRLTKNMNVEGIKRESLTKKLNANHAEVAKSWDCSRSEIIKPDPGHVRGREKEESTCTRSNVSSAPSAAVSEGREAPSADLQLSPQHALRTALLKRRFADTIAKAQLQIHPHNDGKADRIRIQQEKKGLELDGEERARIEAQLNALNKPRQQLREAARLEIEKMEKSVDIDDNLSSMREFEALVGDFSICYCHSARQYNPACTHFEYGYGRTDDHGGDSGEDGIGLDDLEDGELPRH